MNRARWEYPLIMATLDLVLMHVTDGFMSALWWVGTAVWLAVAVQALWSDRPKRPKPVSTLPPIPWTVIDNDTQPRDPDGVMRITGWLITEPIEVNTNGVCFTHCDFVGVDPMRILRSMTVENCRFIGPGFPFERVVYTEPTS